MREPEGAAAEGRPLTIRDFKPAVRRIEQVDWPGGPRGQAQVRPWLLYLHCDEFQASYFAARRWFEDQGQDVAQSVSEEPFNLEVSYQLLQRMLLAARDPARKLFRSIEDCRRELSPNECSFFLAKHAELQATEEAAWAGELPDRTLRNLAMVLGLPLTIGPDELIEAVQQRIAG